VKPRATNCSQYQYSALLDEILTTPALLPLQSEVFCYFQKLVDLKLLPQLVQIQEAMVYDLMEAKSLALSFELGTQFFHIGSMHALVEY